VERRAVEAATGWRERATESLAAAAPASTWRIAAAFVAALACVLATSGGLFLYAGEFQIALVAGVCAGLIAPSRNAGAATALAAFVTGMAIGPSSMWTGPTPFGAATVAAAVLAAATAYGAKALLQRTPASGRWLTWAVVGLLVANLWVTIVQIDRAQLIDESGQAAPSFFQELDGTAVVEQASDEYRYLRVLQAVRQGAPFYATWRDEFGPLRAANASAGDSVFNYHLPTAFWFWAALPGTPVSVVYAYLVLASLAVAAVPIAMRGTVRLPVAIPGAAAVASYLLAYGVQLTLLGGEAWAGALGVIALAAYVRSIASTRWRAWTVAAVALGVLAALVREPAVLLPIAGLASAFAVRDDRRRFRVAAWAAGLAVFAGLYAAHYVNVRPLLSGAATGAQLAVSGIDMAVSALTYGTTALGEGTLLPLLLAAGGIAGTLLLADRRARVFAAACTIGSLVSYLVVNNAARDAATGAAVNYWGGVMVPMVYACLPAALALFPSIAPGKRLSGPAPIADGPSAGSDA
jgi:hypothetical protein